MPDSNVSSELLTREEWEQRVNETLLDLYQGQMKALDLIEANDRNIKELGRIVGKLADHVKAIQ